MKCKLVTLGATVLNSMRRLVGRGFQEGGIVPPPKEPFLVEVHPGTTYVSKEMAEKYSFGEIRAMNNDPNGEIVVVTQEELKNLGMNFRA